MFTIPYDEGWKIFVDEEEVEISKALDTLIAIKVDSGEHEIILRYTPNGMNAGIILTAIGIIMFIVIVIIYKKKLKHNKL